LPTLLGNFVNRKMEDFTSRSQQFDKNQQNKKREGDVTIKYTSETKKHYSQDSGEYVDYEEIKD